MGSRRAPKFALNGEWEMAQIRLNDILGFTDDEIGNVKIRFTDGGGNRYEAFLSDPKEFHETAFLWRTEVQRFSVGQTAISLLKLSSETYLLTTIMKITKELGIKHGANYEGEEIERYTPYFGRVVIKYKKNYQQQVRYANGIIDEMEVLQILPSQFDGIHFPGYDRVRLSYAHLASIVQRRPEDWVGALENQKAVYLIVDKETGKQYVGSATAEKGMLLSRWNSYVANGHGGNKLLIDVVNDEGLDYVKQNFQYAILENYNARVDDKIILAREIWWKETLGSRAFGLNAN